MEEERRRVEEGVCGVGEEESGGGSVWGGRGEEWRRKCVGCGWERRRVKEMGEVHDVEERRVEAYKVSV